MKTITVITPANIEIEYKLAGVGARLAALIIDMLIQYTSILLAAAIIFSTNYQLRDISAIATRFSISLAIFITIAFIIHFGYFILFEMLMNGQTIGKRLFGLRTIRDNGQPIEFNHALLRGVIRATLDMMYIGLFVLLFSKKHKRIGDMAAGTIVVIEKPFNNFDPSFFTLYPKLPDFIPPLSEITTDEREIVEDWLRRRETLPDNGKKIEENLAKYFIKKTAPPL